MSHHKAWALIKAEREWRVKVARGNYVEISNDASSALLAEYDRLQEQEHELKELKAALVELAPAPEWNCPSCGAVTRARMADNSD